MIAAAATAPASSELCERKPPKCSRIDSSSPASEPSARPPSSIGPRRELSTKNDATSSTSAISTTISTSGKLPHGAGGRSSNDVLPAARRRLARGDGPSPRSIACARRRRASSRSAREVALAETPAPLRSGTPRLRLAYPKLPRFRLRLTHHGLLPGASAPWLTDSPRRS